MRRRRPRQPQVKASSPVLTAAAFVLTAWPVVAVGALVLAGWPQQASARPAPRPQGPPLNLAAVVDTRTWTGGGGHTYPGAEVPFGMVQWSADTRPGRTSTGGYFSDSAFASPGFNRIAIHLPAGKTITIIGSGAAAGLIYVRSLTINGRPDNKLYVPFASLKTGATLNFRLNRTPTRWGSAPRDAPPSYRADD